jgi:hypothetical protein
METAIGYARQHNITRSGWETLQPRWQTRYMGPPLTNYFDRADRSMSTLSAEAEATSALHASSTPIGLSPLRCQRLWFWPLVGFFLDQHWAEKGIS